MKKSISTLYIIASGLVLTSCAVRVPSVKTPDQNYYGNIGKTLVTDGFPKKAAPWVVYSDRSKNNPFLKKEKNESPKEINFLEPLLVLDHNKSRKLLRVAEYNADALLKKLPRNSVKSYGWISEDNLLLWSNALSERISGFKMKAAVVPNNTDVISNAAAYLKNDSALVYSSPNFTESLKEKIALGQLVYVFKKSADDKAYLIGKKENIGIDSVANDMYGWISSNMISAWGERSAVKLKNDFEYTDLPNMGIYSTLPKSTEDQPTISLADAADRSVIENIFPTSVDLSKNSTNYFTSAFDHSQNFIINAEGEKLMFNRYKEITDRSKKLNIVFTVDVSAQNRAYSSIAKSLIQDFQLKVKDLTYYNSIKYSIVLYKNNTCGDNVVASVLSNDASGIFTFMDAKMLEMECDGGGGQPVNKALFTAGELLNTVPDETNIVVLIGSTAASNISDPGTIRTLSGAKAKIISYQTESQAADVYNNFVLISENTVTTTSRNIAELNKEKVADQSYILNKNNFSLIEGEKGVYSLDYPVSSMSQGFVIYPKRREANNNGLLIKGLDSLVKQVTFENTFTLNSLRSYFKAEDGANKTFLKGKYSFMFPGAQTPLPANFSSQVISYNNPTLASGYLPAELRKYINGIQKGILVSEGEYDQLRKLYLEIYTATEPDNIKFKQNKAIKKYLAVLEKYNPTVEDLSNTKFYEQPMQYAVVRSTGFDVSNEDVMTKLSLKDWKDKKMVPAESVQKYFKNYKELADRLLENKNNSKIKILQNETTFYWLNEYFMPTVDDVSVF